MSYAPPLLGFVFVVFFGAEIKTRPMFMSAHSAVALDYGEQPGLGPGDALVCVYLN
jgi:hypothetical protein